MTFKDALFTPFRVVLDETHSVEWTLTEVAERICRPGWEAFSLIFTGPESLALWDGLFTVEHPEMGSSTMYLVALGPDADGQHYEAVFHRRQPPADALDDRHPLTDTPMSDTPMSETP
jgi:hypothetical protein